MASHAISPDRFESWYGLCRFNSMNLQSLQSVTKNPLGVIGGVCLGMGATFLFGRDGRRHRAIMRDKVKHYAHESTDFMSKATRDLANRSKGIAHGDLGTIRRKSNKQIDILQKHWSPATKLLVGLTSASLASALVCRGMKNMSRVSRR